MQETYNVAGFVGRVVRNVEEDEVANLDPHDAASFRLHMQEAYNVAGVVDRVVRDVEEDEARKNRRLNQLPEASTRPGFICADISNGVERVRLC